MSATSNAGPQVLTVPDQMSSPIRDALTTVSQIVVDWTPLSSPSNGNSPITSYLLEWDDGTSGASWYDLVGGSPLSTATTYTVTTTQSGGSLIAGTYYRFRVTARNIFGYGLTSNYIAIKAATTPALVPSVSTNIDSTTGNV